MHFFAYRSNLHADCTNKTCCPEDDGDFVKCATCSLEVEKDSLDDWGRCWKCYWLDKKVEE